MAASATSKAFLAALTAAFCYTVSWSCVGIAILYQIAAVLPGWYRDTDAVWVQLRNYIKIEYKLLDGKALIEGRQGLDLTFLFAPAVVASIFTMLPALLFSKETRARGWTMQPLATLAGCGRMVYRYGNLPMWPSRLWLWWCDGLSVFEALLVAGWTTAHIIGIKEMFVYYEARNHTWDMLDLADPVPHSVKNLEWIGLAFAFASYLDLSLLFFPVSHISFLQHLLGSSWPSLIRYHRWLGHFTMTMIVAHGVSFHLYWMLNPTLKYWEMVFDWNKSDSVNFLAGTLAGLSGVALWITTANWIRRKFFQVFYTTHILGFIGFVFFGLMHYYNNWMVMVPGLILWLLDIVYRMFQAQHVSCVSSAHVTPCGTLARLEVPVDAAMLPMLKPGHHVFLQFPDLSRWQWHPFSILQVNEAPGSTPTITVTIKKYARWTKKVIGALQQGTPIPVRMMGPIDHFSKIFGKPSHVVIFAGGVGASPALSVVHGLAAKAQPPNTTLIFAAREAHEFSIIEESLMQEAAKPGSWLQLRLFLTSKRTDATATTEDATVTSIGNLPSPNKKIDHSSSMGSDTSSDGLPVKKLPTTSSFGFNMSKLSSGSEASGSTSNNMSLHSSMGWAGVSWPLQPRLLTQWQMFAALLVAWAGGFLGVVQALGAYAEKWGPARTTGDMWMVGTMLFVCVLVQTTGLPTLLVLLPVHLYKWLQLRKGPLPPAALPKSPYITVLGRNRVGAPESGLVQELQGGRPDITALLEEAVQGAAGEEVPVVVAGPQPMMHSVYAAVGALNSKRPRSQPALRLIREAFEM